MSNALPETLILQLHLEVPSTTCFSDDSRLSMCVSGFTLNTVLRSDKRAHIKTQFICLHTIHPPDLYVCTSYMQRCTATALVELVCYDSPGFELSLDNIVHLPGANIGQQWQISISKLRHTIGRQQHWRQRYSASGQSDKESLRWGSNLWQWSLQTTCWCQAKPSTWWTPWMFCAPQTLTQKSPWVSFYKISRSRRLHKMKATLPATSVSDMLLEIWNHTFAYKFLLSLYSLFGDSLVSLLWPTCITYYPPYQLKHLRPLFLPLLHPLLHRDDDRVRFVVRSVLWALFSGSCEQQFQTFKRFSELCCFNSMVDKI